MRIACLATCAVLLGGCGGSSGDDDDVVAAAEPAAPAGDAIPHAASADAGLLVDVAGMVRRPGVYRMQPGARVHEAIAAAGGARPGALLEQLNRAAPVVDGQQVVVPSVQPVRPGGGGTAAGGPSTAKVSINSGDVAALDTLPGIGPVTADRIVAEREAGGPFATLDDLDRVSGMGPATIEALREAATA